MKKKHKIAIAILLIILIFATVQYYLYAKSFADPVLKVMTESSDNAVGYYEIGSNEKYRKCDQFEPQESITYTSLGAYENQALETWNMYDKDANEIEKDEMWIDMLRKVSEREQDHQTLKLTVFITTDGLCYIQVIKNVNLWTPFVLYRYNPKSAELTYLTTLSGMEVIGLRE